MNFEQKNFWFWVISTVALYAAISTWMLSTSNGIPFVFDGNEAFSSLVHAENIFKFGIWESFGLTDEAYGPNPAAHPFVYTHQGNFPRVFAFFIYALGAQTVEAQAIVTAATVGLAAILFAFLFFQRWAGSFASFVICAIFITDYIMVLQWHMVTYRVWHMFFFFAAFLCVDLFEEPQRRKWLVPTTIALYMSLFYFEFIFATYTAVAAGIYTLCVHLDNPKRALKIVGLQLTGAVLAVVFLIIQNLLYLGPTVFLQDATLTFIARNLSSGDAKFLQALDDFYNDNNIVFWKNFYGGKISAYLTNVIRAIFEFSLSLMPPGLFVAAGLLFSGWVIRTIHKVQSHKTVGWGVFYFTGAAFGGLLLILSAPHISPGMHVIGNYSGAFVIGIILLAVFVAACARAFLQSPVLKLLLPLIVTPANALRLGLMLLASGFVAVTLRSKAIIVLGQRNLDAPYQNLDAVLLLVPSLSAAVFVSLAVVPVLTRWLFDRLSDPMSVRALASIFWLLLCSVAALPPLVIGSKAGGPVIVAIIATVSLIVVWLRPQIIIKTFCNTGTDTQNTFCRIIALLVGAFALFGLKYLAGHTSTNPDILNRLSVIAAALGLLFLWVELLAAAAFVWPRRTLDLLSRSPLLLVVMAGSGWLLLVFALLGGGLFIRRFGISGAAPFGLLLILAGAGVGLILGEGKVKQSLQRLTNHLMTVWPVGLRLLSVAAFAVSFFIFSQSVTVANLWGSISSASVSPIVLQLCGAVALVAALAIIFSTGWRSAPTWKMSFSFAFFSLILTQANTLFAQPSSILWNALNPRWMTPTTGYFMILAAAVASIAIVADRSRDDESKQQPQRVLWLIVSGMAAFMFVLLLSNGYVTTGYLYRYVPMQVLFIDVAIGIGVAAALQFTLRQFRNLTAGEGASFRLTAGGGPLFRRIALPLISIVSLLSAMVAVVWLMNWGGGQIEYTRLAPPDRFSDLLSKLREEPFKGKTSVVNTYAAPVATMTGNWSYMDYVIQSANVTETPEGSKFKSDPYTYLWVADRKTNPEYRQPDMFVCIAPTNLNFILFYLRNNSMPSCNEVNLIKRGKVPTMEQVGGPVVKLLAEDKRPNPAWSVVEFDYSKMSPTLNRIEPNMAERVNLRLARTAKGLTTDIKFASSVSLKDKQADGFITRIYSTNQRCPLVEKKNLTLLSTTNNSANIPVFKNQGTIVATIQPFSKHRRGDEYLSQAIEVDTGKRCRVTPVAIAGHVNADNLITLKWNNFPDASSIELTFKARALDGKSSWPDTWVNIAKFPSDITSNTVGGFLSGYEYRFQIKHCDQTKCWPAVTTDVQLPMTSQGN